MKFNSKNPPRKFRVGHSKQFEILDCGSIELGPDEQVTFVTPSGKEYDVARKDWGFYATPSANGRLKDQGFKTALVKNPQGRVYIMLVEKEKLKEFHAYLDAEKNVVEKWLDEA